MCPAQGQVLGYREVWGETCTLLDSAQQGRGLALYAPSHPAPPISAAAEERIPAFILQLLKGWDIEFCLHFPHCIPAFPLSCSPCLCFSRDPCRQRYSLPQVWQGFGIEAVLRFQRPDTEERKEKFPRHFLHVRQGPWGRLALSDSGKPWTLCQRQDLKSLLLPV